MGTSRAQIKDWFEQGVAKGHSFMVVVCDTFDWSDFPVYYDSVAEARKRAEQPGSMEKTMEVYYLKDPMDEQLNQRRCFNFGPEAAVPQEPPNG